MKNVLLAALWLLVFANSVGAATPPANMASVKPLQVILNGGEDGMGPPYLANICTVTSINERAHYWLTAYHCVAEEGLTYYIMGDKVKPEMKDVVNDLAILSTSVVSAPAVPLASAAVSYGDYVSMIGHPAGQLFPVLSVGLVAADRYQIEFEGTPYTYVWFQLPGAPGSSGSAVFNANGEIVSVLQVGPGRFYAPNVGGVLFEKLAAYRSYFEGGE